MTKTTKAPTLAEVKQVVRAWLDENWPAAEHVSLSAWDWSGTASNEIDLLGPPRREEWFTNEKRKERTPTQEMGHALFMARVTIKRLKTLLAEHNAKCRCEVCKWNETNPIGPLKPLELLRAYVLTSQTILDDVATYGQPEDAESNEWESL